MQFKNLALTASVAATATAAALPSTKTIADYNTFGLIAIHSGSEVQNSGISAGLSSLWINRPQDATCDTASDFATFYLQEGALYLYRQSATPQQIYVDRSGMGQGKIGYTTGAQPAPRNAERTGFAINNGDLQFDGASFQACPNDDGTYAVWLSSVTNPAGYVDCIGIAAYAVETSEPVSCLYSE